MSIEKRRDVDTPRPGLTAGDSVTRLCPGCGVEGAAAAPPMNEWVMARCNQCGLVYTRDVPSQEEIRKLYNMAYMPGQLYDKHLRQLQEMVRTGRARQGFYRNRLFLKRFKPKRGARLLEVGCGIGIFLVAAKQAGWDVEGIDVSSEALAVSTPIHQLPVHHGTLEDLDFQPHTYKAIVCWEVLEHLANPRRFLARARALLRDDGLLVCSVPNTGPRVPNAPPSLWGPAALPPIHLNFWSCDSFRTFIEGCGFRPLYLAPKRILRGMAYFKNRPFQLIWNQAAALLHMREGATIFAVITPISGA